jgi:uncharacterized protein YndB with AHSA1/START domain
MFEILHRVGIKAPANDVHKALATPEGITRWWTVDTTGDGKVGGVVVTRFHVDGRLLGGFDLEVTESKPGARLSWRVVEGPEEWVGTRIHFELKREDDFTIVLFRHEGWKEPVEFMSHCSTKWATFLMSLKALCETGAGRPNPHDQRISNWH